MNPDRYLDSPFGARAPSPWLARLIALTRACPTSWLGKRAAFALRKLGTASLDGPVDATTFGMKMRLYPFNNVCEKRLLYTPQFFDAAERAILAERLRADCVFIDIGANVGGYALFVAGIAGPEARILAIEPQPEIHARLGYNLRANGLNNVVSETCAVADREGVIDFFLSADNRGQASLNDAGGGRLSVPAKTLLGLAREHGLARIDAIKIDVEGAEDIVLEPFFRDAPEALWPGMIVIENSSGQWRVDLLGHLEALGYRRIAKTRLNSVYERAPGAV